MPIINSGPFTSIGTVEDFQKRMVQNETTHNERIDGPQNCKASDPKIYAQHNYFKPARNGVNVRQIEYLEKSPIPRIKIKIPKNDKRSFEHKDNQPRKKTRIIIKVPDNMKGPATTSSSLGYIEPNNNRIGKLSYVEICRQFKNINNREGAIELLNKHCPSGVNKNDFYDYLCRQPNDELPKALSDLKNNWPHRKTDISTIIYDAMSNEDFCLKTIEKSVTEIKKVAVTPKNYGPGTVINLLIANGSKNCSKNGWINPVNKKRYSECVLSNGKRMSPKFKAWFSVQIKSISKKPNVLRTCIEKKAVGDYYGEFNKEAKNRIIILSIDNLTTLKRYLNESSKKYEKDSRNGALIKSVRRVLNKVELSALLSDALKAWVKSKDMTVQNRNRLDRLNKINQKITCADNLESLDPKARYNLHCSLLWLKENNHEHLIKSFNPFLKKLYFNLIASQKVRV